MRGLQNSFGVLALILVAMAISAEQPHRVGPGHAAAIGGGRHIDEARLVESPPKAAAAHPKIRTRPFGEI